MKCHPVLLLRLALIGLVIGLPAHAESTTAAAASASEHRRVVQFSWLAPLSGQPLVNRFGCGMVVEPANCGEPINRHGPFIVGYGSSRWKLGPEAWLDGDPSYPIKGLRSSLGISFSDIGGGPLRVGLSLGAQRQVNQRRYLSFGIEFTWPEP